MTTLDPYPGESMPVYQADDGSGDFVLVNDLGLREGSATFSAGDEWRAWFRPDWQGAFRYLDDPGADVTVSWVLEVLSGTATFTAAEGVDPDWPDAAATAPTSLGTFTVTGPATVVIPSTLIAAEQFTDNDLALDGIFVLLLNCTAGSIVVQQVKVQAAPPGGFGGAWVDMPQWQTTATEPTFYADELSSANFAQVGEQASTYEASWDLAAAAIIGGAPSGTHTHRMTDGYALLVALGRAQQFLDDLVGPVIGTSHSVTSNALVLEGAGWDGNPIDPTLVEGVDWIRPPTEVPGDTDYLYEVTGSGSTLWFDAVAEYTTSVPEEPMGSVTLEAFALDDLTITPVFLGPGIVKFDVELTMGGGGGVTSTGSYALPTGGRYIIVNISHDFLTTANAWPGSTGGALGGPIYGMDGTADVSATTAALMPPYRVWLHTAVEQHPLRLMQRGDGLGMGSGRILGAGTRQNSIRVFGSL